MKLKYRIKEIQFLTVASIWIAQYRILGIWMGIGYGRGYFLSDTRTFCETLDEAQGRIRRHQRNAKRAKEWIYKTTKLFKEF